MLLRQLSDVNLDLDERERLTAEMKSLKLMIEQNNKIKSEMEICLEKNLEQKNIFHETMMRANKIKASDSNEELEDLRQRCRLLQTENVEIRKDAIEIEREKESSEKRIKELESEVEILGGLLKEKDNDIVRLREMLTVMVKILKKINEMKLNI